jgi:epoxyqueuosine reductase
MACQEVCPENRDFLDRTEDAASFSEEETRAIMSRVPPDRLPAALAGKLKAIDLLDDYGILPRNLRALIAARGRSKEGTKS